jgi:hypothetical protein
MTALTLCPDDQPLENLNSLFTAFSDFLMNFNGIAAAYVHDGRFFKASLN